MNRKRSLSSHLSRKDPDHEEFQAGIKEFHFGSDRVAAIMGAALVENNLVRAIEAALREVDGKADIAALFHDEGAPFGTFKRRIIGGKAMGLFNAQAAADMDLIRDIRNQFAHALLGLDFENEHIAAAVGKMSARKFNNLPEREIGANRLKYEKACWNLGLSLLTTANNYLDVKLKVLNDQLTIEKLKTTLFQSGSENNLGGLAAILRGVEH